MDLTERSVEHLHLQTEWPNAQIDLVLVISGCFTASLSAESGKLLSEVTFCCSNVFFQLKYCTVTGTLLDWLATVGSSMMVSEKGSRRA